MVVVTFKHLSSPDWLNSPVHLDVVLPHEAGLPWAVNKSGTLPVGPFSQEFSAVAKSSLFAFFSPKEVIFCQYPPVTTSLSCPEQILGIEEGESVEGELLGQQGDEVPLELGLDDLHHVAHLLGLAAVYQLINGQEPLGVRPAGEGGDPVEDVLRGILLVRDEAPALGSHQT